MKRSLFIEVTDADTRRSLTVNTAVIVVAEPSPASPAMWTRLHLTTGGAVTIAETYDHLVSRLQTAGGVL